MDTAENLRQRFEDFAKGAYLDVLVPVSPNFNAADAVRAGSPEEIGRAPSRRNLFFDENVRIHLVLKTPANESEVRDLLPYIDTRLSAHATETAAPSAATAAPVTGKFDVAADLVPAAAVTEIVPAGEYTYVFWQPTLHLSRPRARLQRPSIYFTANLSLNGSSTSKSAAEPEPHLPPYEPLPSNVLEALNHAPNSQRSYIYLSEDRITKVAPQAVRKEETTRPIRGASKRAYPTLPALLTRVTYSTFQRDVIANLHIEASQFVASSVEIRKVNLDLPTHLGRPGETDKENDAQPDADKTTPLADVSIECLTDAALPMKMLAGDEIALLYKLCRLCRPGTTQPTPITMSMMAIASVEQGLRVELQLSGQSQLDFTKQQAQPIQTWMRTATPTWFDKLDAIPQAPVLPSKSSFTQIRPSPADGLLLCFSAPATTRVYDDFLLSVKVINQSSRSRRFAIRPKETMEGLIHGTETPPGEGRGAKSDLPTTGSSSPQPPAVKYHTSNVEVGPVLGGASAQAVVELRALKTGVVELGTLSIVDLESQQVTDITELPDVIALEPQEGVDPYCISKFARVPAGTTLESMQNGH